MFPVNGVFIKFLNSAIAVYCGSWINISIGYCPSCITVQTRDKVSSLQFYLTEKMMIVQECFSVSRRLDRKLC